MGFELDADSGLSAAADKNLADTLYLRNLLRQDRICHVVDLWLRNHVGGEREDEDRRLSRIRLAITGILWQVGRQLAARGD